MAVSMKDIAHLRKMSGAGMMDCKKALEESNGDFEKAMEIIRKKGQAVAAKRSDRDASEGCVLAGVSGDFACIVALNCETDFVAKNEDFVALTQSILDAALKNQPKSKDELLSLEIEGGRSVEQNITDRSGITGEKMELGAYEYVSGKSSAYYIHPGNRLASIITFNEETDPALAHDLTMQIAAMNPISIDADSVPQEIKDRELQIAREKAQAEGKPENILDRIAQGALQKYYKENTLMQQASIKNAHETIADMLKAASKDLRVADFKRVTLNDD